MQSSPLEKVVLGVVLTVVGLGLTVFHRAIKERRDNWNERAPWILRWSPPGGKIFTVTIILMGAILIYVGIANLVSVFVQ